MNQEQIVKATLEKAYTEYIDYKNHIKDKVKPVDEIRKEVAKETEGLEDFDKISEIFFEKHEKQTIYLQDLTSLLTRLYHTIECYKDILEIPKEILELEELKNYKYQLYYSVKKGKETVTNPEVILNIKNAIKQNISQITKYFKE